MECFSDNVNLNLVRNIFSAIVGCLFILLMGGADFSMPPMGWVICSVAGVVMMVSYIAWITALKTDAFMLVSAANNGSFIIAAFCGIAFFGESISLFKGVAILLVIAAMYFMTLYQTSFGKIPSAHDIFILGLVFVSTGLNATVQKWFTRALPDTSVHLYTFYTFVISIIFLIIYRFVLRSPKLIPKQISTMKSILPWVVFMSVALYGATYFQTLAATMIDAVVLYPMSNAINLVGASIMAWIVLGEKPNKHSIIGTLLVFVALILSRF